MKYPYRSSARVRRGFALVVTIMLMVLVVIAVGQLGLSSISLRTISDERWSHEGRQIARPALTLALGELQVSTGPIQRVTAAAEVGGTNPARPQLTDVWEGWKWDGAGNAPDPSAQKEDMFLRWLVSTREHAATPSLNFAEQPVNQASPTPLVRGIRIADEQVDAEVVAITGEAAISSQQGFAWAVFEKSTKLPVALPERESDSIPASLSRMTAAPIPGYASITTNSRASVGEIGGGRLKLVSPEQAALVAVTAANRGIHDLSTRSAGLAVDFANGGEKVLARSEITVHINHRRKN
jgi:hypothetical protein